MKLSYRCPSLPTYASCFARNIDYGRSESFRWNDHEWPCPVGEHWRVSMDGLERLAQLGRLDAAGLGFSAQLEAL